MNNRPIIGRIDSTSGKPSKDIEQLYEIMVIANKLSKECLEREDFRAFTKANEIFNNARDIIQRCDKVESS
ncbi:hypothetical protein [uncultured Bacteroides sp.]|uniref:hypothetical protein n=1 Tax=uncultured Bacteroides sp. TaxID=162156 RepID=UPI002AAC3574|nr:hypothetical protein [uncultured Bacteroides sp.]